jgi:hypothetical protein
MSLLREIQEAIVDPKSELAPILLKVRILADRLGSGQLEEWVKLESEGYPAEIDVPEYRKVSVTYTACVANIAWRATNQPIPTALISKFAGDHWTPIGMRESMAAIDDLLSKSEGGGGIGIDASNLILLLQDKIFEGSAISSVTGRISATGLREIQNAVRTRILELTMKLEKEVPGSGDVTISKPLVTRADITEKVAHVVNMTVHGPNTMITSTGSHTAVTVNNVQGDVGTLRGELVKAGIPDDAATEFSEIVSAEKPDADQSFGPNARKWIARNIATASDGTWKVGLAVAAKLLEEAALRYYGLK